MEYFVFIAHYHATGDSQDLHNDQSIKLDTQMERTNGRNISASEMGSKIDREGDSIPKSRKHDQSLYFIRSHLRRQH